MGKTLFPLEKGFPHVTARPNLISVVRAGTGFTSVEKCATIETGKKDKERKGRYVKGKNRGDRCNGRDRCV